jgi:hypothetical protein
LAGEARLEHVPFRRKKKKKKAKEALEMGQLRKCLVAVRAGVVRTNCKTLYREGKRHFASPKCML